MKSFLCLQKAIFINLMNLGKLYKQPIFRVRLKYLNKYSATISNNTATQQNKLLRNVTLVNANVI